MPDHPPFPASPDLPIERWTYIEPEVDAIQVTAENARAVAAWCGGWACDDLRWNEHMRCYHRPADDPEYPGAMLPTWDDSYDEDGDDGQRPGGVMMKYGVPHGPGYWIVHVGNHHRGMTDAEFRARYRKVVTDG